MKRLLTAILVTGSFLCPVAKAQVNCGQASVSSKLVCLIPDALNLTTPSAQNLGFLNEAIGTQVSDLPLASPASGIIYKNDPKLNLPVPSSETLGPVLTQRAETIGRHKMYIAATYQFFRFEDIDGIGLKQLPILLLLQDGSAATVSNNRLDLTVNQMTAYFTFGVTSRIDASVAVPVLDVHEQFTTSGVEYCLSSGIAACSPVGSIQSFQNHIKSGAVRGLGDVVLAAKGTVWKPSKGGLAIGAELRLPSGDALNFLGSGTIGFKPYVSWTYGHRFSPHLNVAYQVNGKTALLGNGQGGKGHLPDRLFYSGGADWGMTKWMTIAGDVLSQRIFSAQRVEVASQSITNPSLTYSTLQLFTRSYDRTDGSIGIKVKSFGNMVMTGNVLVALNQGGLRTRVVPFGGLSYTF